MEGVLSDKRAVITGAASGIGRAVAQQAAADGPVGLCVDEDDVGLKSLADSLPEGVLAPLVCDLADPPVDSRSPRHIEVARDSHAFSCTATYWNRWLLAERRDRR